MEHVAAVLEASDSPWGVLALVVLGAYAFMWKFGKEILATVRETKTVAKDVQTSIITNHGSKNLGDAIDRLTGWVMDDREQADTDRVIIRDLAEQLSSHIETCTPLAELAAEVLREKEASRGYAQH